jgi:hypothetical protein
MTWGSRPGSNIPTRIKDQVRRRDQVCQLNYPNVCSGRIDEFDHVIGLADQGQQRTAVRSALEIRGVCSHCHAIRTEAQRRAGRARARAQRGGLSRRLRDREAHPGTL